MAYVITCGDEGVQINEGRRLAVVGAGFRVDDFAVVISHLKTLFGSDIAVVSNEENEWVRRKLDLVNWEQVNAMSQQHTQAMAEREGLLYSGYLPFADPKQLQHGVKGHMVRPHKVHIANKISFTLAGGEQTYNLGNYVVSAEWVHLADKKLATRFIQTQIEFYKSLGNPELSFVFEEAGELGEEVAAKNKAVLESILA